MTLSVLSSKKHPGNRIYGYLNKKLEKDQRARKRIEAANYKRVFSSSDFRSQSSMFMDEQRKSFAARRSSSYRVPRLQTSKIAKTY